MPGKILVHCCCGPCSTSSVKRLIEEGWEVVLYFENSNIYPYEENTLRYENLLKVASLYGLEVIRGEYDHDSWLEFIKGWESEPEHGKRCLLCFEYNLRRASEVCQGLGIRYFTTTLTVSRFKNSRAIFDVGKTFPGFQEIDFKKKDGFAESVRMSREMGLYRQSYCGCEFSMNAQKDSK